jgi:response regulator RpfG family c-di-GMP phosphodiesterase
MATVLAVGHETNLITLMRWMLEDEGYVVVHAVNGGDALVTLRTCEEAMIVVLLTTRPHVHTLDILEGALREPAVQRHAFILLTAVSDFLPQQWRKVILALDVPVLAKPFGVKHLMATVAEVAARQRASANLQVGR